MPTRPGTSSGVETASEGSRRYSFGLIRSKTADKDNDVDGGQKSGNLVKVGIV